ncbi:hypothetical protein Rsub_09101 [Raphidocelis subcapitata]|uniref:Uncharacterized protein n=1 Tax=Raphidocelis subcapitata TaxID=307507 RepID=A0A2V0P8Y5_9CHLO|nr:hypothetical protein Rsub_09101 [Raphidocelis subcapitata]|eukprot:GBF96306.1 hypothetical protein Rsub_09101 [Raphidocelis subcapitata]
MIAQRVQVQATTRAATARRAVVVRAQQQQNRRSLLGLIATGVAVGAAALLPAGEAAAIKIASQEFTGGLVRGGGNSTKSASKASQAGYTLEGTKKTGITPKRKAKLLAKTREAAVAKATKAK